MKLEKFTREAAELVRAGDFRKAADLLLAGAEEAAENSDEYLEVSDRMADYALRLMEKPIEIEGEDRYFIEGDLGENIKDIECQLSSLVESVEFVKKYFEGLRGIALFQPEIKRPISRFPVEPLFEKILSFVESGFANYFPSKESWEDILEEIRFQAVASTFWRPAPKDKFYKYFGYEGGTVVLKDPIMRNGCPAEIKLIFVKEGHYFHYANVIKNKGELDEYVDLLDLSVRKINDLLNVRERLELKLSCLTQDAKLIAGEIEKILKE